MGRCIMGTRPDSLFSYLRWMIFPSIITIVGVSIAFFTLTESKFSDELLYLLIIPCLLSAVVYTRRIYIAASLLSVSLAMTTASMMGLLTDTSQLSTLVIGFVLLSIGEFLYQTRKKYLDYQENLIREKHLLDVFFEDSPNAMQALDKAGTILDVNKMWCELMGYSKEEVVGTPLINLVPEEMHEQYMHCFSDLLETGRISNTESMFRTKSGDLLTILADGVVIREADGSYYRTLCVLRNHTEQKRLQQSIRDERDKLEVLLKSSADLVCAMDEDYNIIFVSDRYVDQFGPSEEKKCYHLFCGLDKPCGQNCAVEEIIHNQKDFFSYSHNDTEDVQAGRIVGEAARYCGKGNTFETESRPFMYKGKRCVLEISRDVSHVRNLEEQLQHTAKMESIGRLAGGVAHDFNNILLAVNGYAELLEKMDPAETSFPALIREIKNAGNRGASLTNQLLAFSRKQIISPRTVNLNESIASLDKMLQRLLGEDVQIEQSLDPNLNMVLIDPGQIDSIIINLAINSRDAMPSGGTFSLTTRNSTADDIRQHQPNLVAEGDFVALHVSDQGTGISPEIVEKIFEPFFTTKEQGKGTGLGLSMVYGIVKQNEGFVFVQSEIDQGTTFSIYLPARAIEQPTQDDNDASKTPEGMNSARLLVVEDDKQVAEMLRMALEMAGYSITVSNSLTDARKTLSGNGGFDLVLSDIVLTDGIGTDLMNSLPKTNGGKEPRWMFMSGYTDDEMARRNIAADGNHFIAKPFLPDELISRVQDVLNE